MTKPQVVTSNPLEVAARALHAFTLSHYQLSYPDGPPTAWDDLSEEGRQATRVLAKKAAEAATFEDFYAFTTLAQNLAGIPVPAAHDDTERTRGARAQYAIVQSLTRIEFGDTDVQADIGRKDGEQ